MNTRAAGKMLVRWRLGTLWSLAKEDGLTIGVKLVKSCQNHADSLTRVPRWWMDLLKEGIEPVLESSTMVGRRLDKDQVADIHHQSRHPGAKRTLYFARFVDPQVSKETANSVVKACETCRSIYPVPVRWKKGKLGVTDNWNRLAMGITHHNGENFLTIIDCGPSRFAIWQQLRQQDAPSYPTVGECFHRERPTDGNTDNDTAFTSKDFREFARNWDVHLRFRCAYSPSGNGIVERSHRTVKTIAARKNCSILEAVYWHNVTSKDDVSPCTAPADTLHRYYIRIKGVEDNPLPEPEVTKGMNEKGDVVWVMNPSGKCTTKYSSGRVTEVISPQSVKIDGVPRHVKDLRLVIQTQLSSSDESDSEDSERLIYLNSDPLDSDSDASSLPTDEVSIETRTADESTHKDEASVIPLRRSTRQRRKLFPCPICDHEIRGDHDLPD